MAAAQEGDDSAPRRRRGDDFHRLFDFALRDIFGEIVCVDASKEAEFLSPLCFI